MADQNFWFPSQTGSIYTPAGDMRIKIFYDDGTAADNTDVGADISKLSPLNMPFEVSPSSQSYRFPSMQITFNNPIYDATNNVWEQYSILNSTYKYQTFIKIYLDGSEKWHGIIDFSQKKIPKSAWYLDGSDLKYREINIKCYDALAYFWYNDVTVNDVGYADGDSIKTTLDNILAEIGIATGDVDFDSTFGISEECSNSYDATTLLFYDLDDTVQCRTFLKNFMIAFGVFIYNYGGTFYINFRTGGSTKNITSAFIKSLEKIENGNPIEYVKFKTDINWNDVILHVDFSLYTDYEHLLEYGDATAESNQQVIIDATGILDKIYIDYGVAAQYPTMNTRLPTDSSETYLEDAGLTSPPNDFYEENVESGMALRFRTEGDEKWSVIQNVISEIRVNFIDIDAIPGTSATEWYWVVRNPGESGREDYIYKVQKLIELVGPVYNSFFLTSPDIHKITLRDISEFDNFTQRFVLFSNNHRAKDIKIYFDKDELTMELVQVT